MAGTVDLGRLPARYPFPVPEWTRTIWASPEAQAVWQPRLTRIGQAWEAVERASVGVFRLACRQAIAPDQVPELAVKAAARSLLVVPLAMTGQGRSYQAGPSPLVPGGPWVYTVALAVPGIGPQLVRAWAASDDRVLGQLFGYPDCCLDFYQRTWVEGRWVDPTWPMAVGTDTAVNDRVHPRTLVVDCAPGSNILLRWLGVRWVPHLPCSLSCQPTLDRADQYRALMAKECPEETDWIDELLSGPVEWSAWHGIAEIKTPLLKISTKTDATADRYTVQKVGRRIPEASSRGVGFPYDWTPEVKTDAQPLPLVRPEAPAPVIGPTLWTDNGFSSLEAMRRAHQTVAEVAGPDLFQVLDLGCGNGVLARLIAGRGPRAWTLGVEIDPTRSAEARHRLNDVITGDIAEVLKLPLDLGKWDCILLMPGRLVEYDEETRARVVARLRGQQLLVYAYDDWLSDGLLDLCHRAGLPGTIDQTSARHDGETAAGWWVWEDK